jgi:hypothetical protein
MYIHFFNKTSLIRKLILFLVFIKIISCSKDKHPVKPEDEPEIDTLPPILIVDSLPDTVSVNSITITGKAYDESGISVLTLNQDTVPIEPDSTFSIVYPLTSMKCTLAITAVDSSEQENKTHFQHIIIFKDTTPPVINIYSMPDTIGTSRGIIEVMVSGKVYDQSGISLFTVNGDSVPIRSDSCFFVLLTLPAENCTLNAVAIDNSPQKNQNSWEHTITVLGPSNITGTWEVVHKKKITLSGDLVYEYDTDTVYVLKLSFFPDGSMQRFTITGPVQDSPRFAFLLYENYYTSNDSLYEFPDSLLDDQENIHHWNPGDGTFTPDFPVKAYPINALLTNRTYSSFTEKRLLYDHVFYFDFKKVSSEPLDLKPDLLNWTSHPIMAKARSVIKTQKDRTWDIGQSGLLR